MLKKEKIVKTNEDGTLTVTAREPDPLAYLPRDIFVDNAEELIAEQKRELEEKEKTAVSSDTVD